MLGVMRCWSIALLLTAPLLAQELEDEAFSVSGSVLTPSRKPADAAVYLWDGLAGDRPLATGRTDEQGKFKLTVSWGDAARRDHPFGPVRVVVHQPGLARAERSCTPGARGTEFRLVKPARWAGSVRSAAGDPLPGAPVVARQGLIRLATTTDEQGRFSFADLAPGTTSVSADATGYRAGTLLKAPFEFKLQALPLVQGSVLDAKTNRPLAGVHVVVLDADAAAETDSDGKFALEVEGGCRCGSRVPRWVCDRPFQVRRRCTTAASRRTGERDDRR